MRFIAFVTGAASLFTTHPARAVDVELQSTTLTQAYEVTSPWGSPNLDRRRLLQTISLGLYNLQGQHSPNRPDYSVMMMLRLDADFGANAHLSGADAGGETDYARGGGARYLPGYQAALVDVMFGYVEGKRLADGWLGFRLGRQYIVDALGWWSFDGARVQLTTPYFVQAEIYGGFEQRGGLPLSTSRYEPQGIWRGSHARFGAAAGQPNSTTYPSYQFSAPAPAFGVALETSGLSFAHGRFTYRRVYNTAASITQQFPGASGNYPTLDEVRISQERIGYELGANLPSVGGLKGGFSYDLYNQLVGMAQGSIDLYLGQRLTGGVDVDYFVPTFDADSIWNWFTRSPITTATGRVNMRLSERFDIAASGGVRSWSTDADPESFRRGQCAELGLSISTCDGAFSETDSLKSYTRAEENRTTSLSADALANLSGRYRLLSAELGLRAMLQAGKQGRRLGADLSGEKRLDGGRYAFNARVSLYDWDDPLRPDRSATSFMYVLGAGYRLLQMADMRLEWEHDMNRLVGHRFRVLGALSLRVSR
ncbi:hypothetical protein [Chondromyces crocatus]|uniref:hypothetical protein n=1 Tax=Chondromyces crocatus TaxID=52 RepID=UPI001FDF9BD2|nr:hypothetical protein [Chondromyces crocatus]